LEYWSIGFWIHHSITPPVQFPNLVRALAIEFGIMSKDTLLVERQAPLR
jgi:hypothetical protein